MTRCWQCYSVSVLLSLLIAGWIVTTTTTTTIAAAANIITITEKTNNNFIDANKNNPITDLEDDDRLEVVVAHAAFANDEPNRDRHWMINQEAANLLDVVDQHALGNIVNKVKPTTTFQQQQAITTIINRKKVSKNEWMMKNQIPAIPLRRHHQHHNNIRNNRQRKAQSCVKSVMAFERSLKNAGSNVTYEIRVCTKRLRIGTLIGGYDVSNLSILLTCLLKQRCILDGEGMSPILYGTNATVMMEGFQFLNGSSFNGGSLRFSGSSNIMIKDCSFLYNVAQYGGGAIMMDHSTLLLQNSHRQIQFLHNQATYGGAIYLVNNSTMQTNITSTKISTSSKHRRLPPHRPPSQSNSSKHIHMKCIKNHADEDGGALYVRGGVVGWDGAVMEQNSAMNGGAVALIGVDCIMTNTIMSRNTANTTGGAIVVVNSSIWMIDSSFDSNRADDNNGAISVFTSKVTLTNTTFLKSCWSDSSVCINGTTCNLCCNPAIYWITKQFTACGLERCWSDGRICGEGTSCSLCCSTSQYWYSKNFISCGREPCWVDGTKCSRGINETCHLCCNNSTYWFAQSFDACGVEP